MKKFASITIAMLMVVSMMLSSIVSTSADTVDTLVGNPTGSITLNKYVSGTYEEIRDEVTGEITEIKGEPVPDATFVAYQVMSLVADPKGDATFTVNPEFDDYVTEADLVHTGTSTATGKLFKSTAELEKKIPDLEAVAVDADITKTYTPVTFKEEKTMVEGDTVGTGKYVATDLPLGIYLVVETVVPGNYIKDTKSFLVSIPEWDGSAWNLDIKATPKNSIVYLEKGIDIGKDEPVDDAVYAIGDVVDYVVEAQIPNYGMSENDPTKRLTEYLKSIDDPQYAGLTLKFTDTAVGVEFDENSLVIESDGYTFDDDGEDAEYTATFSEDKKSFTVVFESWDVFLKSAGNKAGKDLEGKEITLRYSAVLDKTAQIESPNPNTVRYEFKRNPADSEPTALEDPARVYTYQMNILKKFENNKVNDLDEDEIEGNEVDATVVTFELYNKKDTTKAITVSGSDGVYTLDPKSTETQFNLKDDGTLQLKGLKPGDYYLKEIATAKDYAIPTTAIEFTLTEKGIEKEGYTHIGVTPTHCTNTGVTEPLKLVGTSNNIFEIEINNVKRQFTLPTTGGMGLWLFTIAGGILMAGAIILFTSLRKKSTSK